MFDEIPARFWLVVLIALVALVPARYVVRHVAHSPDRRDITQAPEDLSWRTSGQLLQSLFILVLLAAVAAFIFTPAAETFARSPSFMPIALVVTGKYALYTVVTGLRSGRIQPFLKGFSAQFERATRPKRYWASLCWNATFACMAFWLAYVTNAEDGESHCYDRREASTPKETLAACTELLARSDVTKDERADLLAARGLAYHKLGDYERALADYGEAITLDPGDATSLYNRGVIYEREGDRGSALVAYSEALELRPDHADAHLYRARIFLDRGQFDEAAADFTRAHELRPDDPWAIAGRGITYAWQQKRALAEQDFSALRAIDPSNPTLLRGEALLGLQAGNPQTAVDRLSKVLLSEPKDAWSLNMRAEAYRQLGDMEKAQADRERLWRIVRERAPSEITTN